MIYSTMKASLPLNLQQALTDRVHLQWFRHNCGYSRRNYFASNLLLAGRDATSLAFLTEVLQWKFLCENNCVASDHGDGINLNLQQGAKKKYNIFFMVKKRRGDCGFVPFFKPGTKRLEFCLLIQEVTFLLLRFNCWRGWQIIWSLLTVIGNGWVKL